MKKRGFTLIELLVVISIISLLSSIVLASINSARAKARDAIRLEDLRQLNLAIQMYVDDNKEAPNLGIDCTGHLDTCHMRARSAGFNLDTGNWAILGQQLNKYIKKIPVDPLNGKTLKGPESDCWQNFDGNGGGNRTSIDPITCSNTYRYIYERFDTYISLCRINQNPQFCLKDAYVLYLSGFETKATSRIPISVLLGSPYPKHFSD